MTILPSPASSPSATHNDLSPHISRKRQRSQSMESDASSSSLKRSVPDATPRDGPVPSPRADRMSTLSLTDLDQDIDAYMAEQGEQSMSAILIPESHPAPVPAFQSVPPAEKIAFIKRGKERKMEKGESWYLISRDWWKRWSKACTGAVDKEGPVSEQDLCPVDNSSIVDASGNIRADINEGVDVEYVPEEVWLSFVFWYVCIYFLFFVSLNIFCQVWGTDLSPSATGCRKRGVYKIYFSRTLPTPPKSISAYGYPGFQILSSLP
jgi:ubiquitin carboxyl-terminal hydrolase 4/11/15